MVIIRARMRTIDSYKKVLQKYKSVTCVEIVDIKNSA